MVIIKRRWGVIRLVILALLLFGFWIFKTDKKTNPEGSIADKNIPVQTDKLVIPNTEIQKLDQSGESVKSAQKLKELVAAFESAPAIVKVKSLQVLADYAVSLEGQDIGFLTRFNAYVACITAAKGTDDSIAKLCKDKAVKLLAAQSFDAEKSVYYNQQIDSAASGAEPKNTLENQKTRYDQ